MSASQMVGQARAEIVRPAAGLAHYMVFLPDVTGSRAVGSVTHCTTGEWNFQRNGRSTCRIAYDRRRDAVRALVIEVIAELPTGASWQMRHGEPVNEVAMSPEAADAVERAVARPVAVDRHATRRFVVGKFGDGASEL